MSNDILKTIEKNFASEILLIDYINEGSPEKYNDKIIDLFPIKSVPIIAFGGIGLNNINKILLKKNVNAVAIGNVLNYSENSIRNIKSNYQNLLRYNYI